jgi:hypothetical protein
MATQRGLASTNRTHIVLIPGFGGFDALGQVEYYAGVTTLFQEWIHKKRIPAVIHYFDNLPTAAVSTRATRLSSYLAKRMVRGEILEDDKVVLVGHSTGGLDIRQLVSDLHARPDQHVCADGGAYVLGRRDIRSHLDAVVFLSVPHWGTNIADWVNSHPGWRQVIVRELQAAVEGAQIYPVDAFETQIAGGVAFFTDAELALAAKDALTEANENYGIPGPSRTADAQEAASELGLFFRHMSSDFSVINDLSSQLSDPDKKSPAHLDEQERKRELELWRNPRIRTLSFATVGSRPFRFRSGSPAPVWQFTRFWTYPEIAKDLKLSAGTDLSYRLCYRACAGGPFQWPANPGSGYRVLGPAAPKPLELWDNDGIVNTASMFWPQGKIILVTADHLDIVGHYKLVEASQDGADADPDNHEPARRYRSYDALKSTPQFADRTFKQVWNKIFTFAINAKANRRATAGAGGT